MFMRLGEATQTHHDLKVVFTKPAAAQQSSWPQWNAVTLKRSIEQFSATTLRVVTAPNNDPKEGAFTVHLE
jgi:hypothetical protein